MLDGQLLRKPSDAAQAEGQLTALNGKQHMLITGMALVCERTHALRISNEATRLTMRHLDPAEIKAYVATGEWKGCVGSYRVEGQGLKLFERIDGDLTNARGLPVLKLCSALRSLGAWSCSSRPGGPASSSGALAGRRLARRLFRSMVSGRISANAGPLRHCRRRPRARSALLSGRWADCADLGGLRRRAGRRRARRRRTGRLRPR